MVPEPPPEALPEAEQPPATPPQRTASPVRGEMAACFETDNTADADNVMAKMAGLQLEFDPQDLEFWFGQLEMHMTTAGVGQQWTKRLILDRNLPKYVKDEIKDILRKTQAKAGNTPYKDLKDRVLLHFGISDEDLFEKASALTLTGKPSALAKQLADLLCTCEKPLDEGCCAVPTVTGLWKRQLPVLVKTAVAGKSLAKDWGEVLRIADAVSTSMTPSPATGNTTTAAVAVVTTTKPAEGAASTDVAAVAAGRGRGRGGRQQYQRGRGRGRGATANATRANRDTTTGRGPRHPDGPPESACDMHWKWGRSAHHCSNWEQCPWKDQVSPPQDKKKTQ